MSEGNNHTADTARDAGATGERCIWVVDGHGAFENARGWRPFEAQAETEASPAEIIEAMRLTKAGHFLPPERFPTDNFPRRADSVGAHRERIPQMFSNGFIFLREESAEVVRQFDLGEGALYPTRLWHPDRTTMVPGRYFYLSQGNRKNAFLKDRSPDAYKFPGNRWRLPPNPTHDQLVFSAAALEGPDLWWDESIGVHFFISDRLAQALKRAKVDSDWKLLRCPVI
jgi:hypothetical protein